MITVESIGSNMAELTTHNNNRILFSYKTPVAAYVVGTGYIKRDTWYSKTTSRHINKWIKGASISSVNDDTFYAFSGLNVL